ncbi:MAG: hypothetical protein F6K36_01075 [Symploca sp. SIO3C6]|nr:hypothetical protein [Symploca sp. SIO3C6]
MRGAFHLPGTFEASFPLAGNRQVGLTSRWVSPPGGSPLRMGRTQIPACPAVLYHHPNPSLRMLIAALWSLSNTVWHLGH